MSENVVPTTPMMQQYRELKNKIPQNVLLLFRLGDFYELFDDDALIGSKVLGITLTQRQGIPMAGIPHHAADTYIERLINAGYKVAICDQTEVARPGKIVHRQISKILSPGTLISENLLAPNHNEYLLCLKFLKKEVVLAWIEVSTGEFQIANATNLCELEHLIFALNPKEIAVDKADQDVMDALPTREREALKWILDNRLLTELPHYYFDQQRGLERLLAVLHVNNLRGFGIENEDSAITAAGALLAYVSDNLQQTPQNIEKIRKFQVCDGLMIDAGTLRNLELLRNTHGGREHTLLSILDDTRTAIGARLLEKWVMHPSISGETIVERQKIVTGFLEAVEGIQELKKQLDAIADIPRILTRISNNIRNPRELGALRLTLQQLPKITTCLEKFQSTTIQTLTQKIDLIPDLRTFLEQSLVENLPSDIADGGYIKEGYNEQVDHLRQLVHHTSNWLCQFEQEEQRRTGIKNLRIKYNNNFGYFIEVTKSNLHLVPTDYVRRQTTVNAERYTTPALKEKEREILSAHDDLIVLEQALLKEVAAEVLKWQVHLMKDAAVLAKIDVLSGWAQLSKRWGYCRPEIVQERVIEIQEGRHPVIERILKESNCALADTRTFVANDTALSESTQIALITGPNMAGKSTYIRQVALIVIMAQMGCNVPAKGCRLGLVDRIFSRIGANDDLVNGASTFMVEMNETANILNNATESSLVILDEVGRGTSTYDGLSLAWAIVEFLHDHWKVGPRTLFATHYHELTKLSETLERLRNYHAAVKEWNGEVIFLRTIEPGSADKSYGIHVARLAGMPNEVIQRAGEVLEKLESEGDLVQRRLQRRMQAKGDEYQLNFGL